MLKRKYVDTIELQDRLFSKLNNGNSFEEALCKFIAAVIDETPAADVVEVVRCECCDHKVDFKGRVMCNRRASKHGDEWYGLTATDNDHFCNYGVAKMDEEDKRNDR